MARNESDAKIGAYPLDIWRAHDIINLFAPSIVTGRVYDPFCNTAEVLGLLGENLNMQVYGSEIQDIYGKVAQEKYGDYIVLGDAYTEVVASSGGFSMVYNNPPYSTDYSDRETKRSEFKAIKLGTKMCQIGGWHIIVMYAHNLNRTIAQHLIENYEGIFLYYWEEKHLETYNQIVIVARKIKKMKAMGTEMIDELENAFNQAKTFPNDYSYWKNWRLIKNGPPKGSQNSFRIGAELSRTVLPDGKVKVVRDNRFMINAPEIPQKRFSFAARTMTAERAIELVVQNFKYIESEFNSLFSQNFTEQHLGNPIHDVRYSQALGLVSSGMINGVVLDDPINESRKIAVRGQVARIRKHERTEEREDDAETVIRTYVTRPTPVVYTMDNFGTITRLSEEKVVAEFLALHTDTLLKYFSEKYKPTFDYTIMPEWAAVFDAHRVKGKYDYIPTQEVVATATFEQLASRRYDFLIAQMSFGKTVVSIAAAILLRELWKQIHSGNKSDILKKLKERYPQVKKWHSLPPNKPVVCVVPSQVLDKWQSEIETTYKHAIVLRPQDISQLADAMRQCKANTDRDKIYFILFSYNKMKLSERTIGVSARLSGKAGWINDYNPTRGYYWKNADRGADPVTGNPIIDNKKRYLTRKQIAGAKRVDVYEGRVFNGYVTEEEEEWSYTARDYVTVKKQKPEWIYALNARTKYPYQRHWHLPLFSLVREVGVKKLSDIDNGIMKAEKQEVEIDKRFWYKTDYDELLDTITKKLINKFSSLVAIKMSNLKHWVDVFLTENNRGDFTDEMTQFIGGILLEETVLTQDEIAEAHENGSLRSLIENTGFMRLLRMERKYIDHEYKLVPYLKKIKPGSQIIIRRKITAINPDEDFSDDPWLAMQGIRPKTKIKKSVAIQRVMDKHKLQFYRWGSGVKDLDVLLEKAGLSTYTSGEGSMAFRNPRISFADFLKKFMKKNKMQIGLLIADEIHRAKSTGSGDGTSMRSMIGMSDMALFDTGTLSNGKASSLYNIMSVINTFVMEHFPWRNGVPTSWIDMMGAVKDEVVEKNEKNPETGAYTGKRKTTSGAEGVEVPAMSPAILRYLTPFSTTALLSDLQYEFQPLEEVPIILDMLPEQDMIYKAGFQTTHDYNAKCVSIGDGSYAGAMYHYCFGEPDLMWMDNKSIHRIAEDRTQRRSKYTEFVVYKRPALPEDIIYPKETKMLEIIKEAVANGERVIVYTTHSGDRADLRQRLAKVIEKEEIEGVKTFLLSSSTPPEKRMAYINSKIEDEYNIMVCNPFLVSEGVDLIMFSRQIFFDVDNRYAVMAQAAARTRRQGQKFPVFNYYFAYRDVFQLLSLFNLAKKETAAALISGSETGSLASLEESDETTSMSVSEMIKAINDGTLNISSEDVMNAFAEKKEAIKMYQVSPWSKYIPRKQYQQDNTITFDIDLELDDEEDMDNSEE